MTNQEKQKLNEKLAREFLGVKKIYYSEWDEDKTSPMFIPSGKPWRTHQIDSCLIPRFTDSLDSCFQGLVRKLSKDSWDAIRFRETPDGWVCQIYSDRLRVGYDGYGASPSVALCLAVEKLIDRKVNV